MNIVAPTPNRRSGRPLSFNRDVALHRAMLMFWRHGYEATSVGDLTRTMGIAPPSLYAAFGDKKRLFLEAVALYLGRPLKSDAIIDDATTARDAASGLLRGAALAFTGADTPPGCLLASAAISCSDGAVEVQQALSGSRQQVEARLRDRIAAGIRAGEMPADTDAGSLAAYVTAVIQGMSTLARDGAPRARLMRVVETAMRAWPEGSAG